MSYRCEVCQKVSEPGVQQHKHAVMRNVQGEWRDGARTVRQEVSRELAVCPSCHNALTLLHVPLATLLATRGMHRPVKAPPPTVPYNGAPKASPLPVRRASFNVKGTVLPQTAGNRLVDGMTSLAAVIGHGQSANPNPAPDNMPRGEMSDRLADVEPSLTSLIHRCDLCGTRNIDDGQRTAESTLCRECLRRHGF